MTLAAVVPNVREGLFKIRDLQGERAQCRVHSGQLGFDDLGNSQEGFGLRLGHEEGSFFRSVAGLTLRPVLQDFASRDDVSLRGCQVDVIGFGRHWLASPSALPPQSVASLRRYVHTSLCPIGGRRANRTAPPLLFHLSLAGHAPGNPHRLETDKDEVQAKS